MKTTPGKTRATAKSTTRKAAAGRKPEAAKKSPATRTAKGSVAAAKPRPKRTPAAAKTAVPKTPSKAPSRKRTPAAAAARTGVRKRTSRAPKPKAMEISYSGRIFRSRLEARWAILMDLFAINWDYEPSHYQVGPELYYLPDFYLPDHRLWLEVKGPAFMDAQSFAKCVGAVAGPNPLPLREYPYTAADRLLLAGPLPQKPQATPVHTLITKAAPGKAALSYTVLRPVSGASIVVESWEEAEATGIPKARRPGAAQLERLLEPAVSGGPAEIAVLEAYRFAANAVFDDASRALSTGRNPAAILERLAGRRAGRPLGPFTVAAAAHAA